MPHSGLLPTPVTYRHVWTQLTSNSLISIMKTYYKLVVQPSLTYSHVADKASYLVIIGLIFVFFWLFLIGIYSMQGTATIRHGITRKKSLKKLKLQEICLERTYS